MPLAGFEYRYEPAPPPASGRTLLLLHGTGGDEHDLIPLGRALDAHAALLSPRGQVLEHGAPRFFRRLAEGVFDVDDLHRRTVGLVEFIRQAAATHAIDQRMLIAVGFSNGANIAASVLLSSPATLAGAILIRAMVPFEPADAKASRADPSAARGGGASPGERVQEAMRSRPRVLLSEGMQDPIVPRAQGERLAALLEEGGADVSLVWQRAGHQLTQADVSTAQAWLAASR